MSEIEREALAAGLSLATLRAVRMRLGIISVQRGSPARGHRRYWRMPESAAYVG